MRERTTLAGLSGAEPEELTAFGSSTFPGQLGIEVISATPSHLTCRVPIRNELLAPHGYLHGGVLVSVADTLCGLGVILNLPVGATGFLTMELTTNFLGTARCGSLVCHARPLHIGGRTQVWDALVSDEESHRQLAVFRCTQMVMWE